MPSTDAIKDQLEANFSQRSSIHIVRDGSEIAVDLSYYDGADDPCIVSICLTDAEWIEYYEACQQYDEDPLSLMAVHLDEAVYIAVERQHKHTEKIVLDSAGFTPVPTEEGKRIEAEVLRPREPIPGFAWVP